MVRHLWVHKAFAHETPGFSLDLIDEERTTHIVARSTLEGLASYLGNMYETVTLRAKTRQIVVSPETSMVGLTPEETERFYKVFRDTYSGHGLSE
jgi:hypothetical protein